MRGIFYDICTTSRGGGVGLHILSWEKSFLVSSYIKDDMMKSNEDDKILYSMDKKKAIVPNLEMTILYTVITEALLGGLSLFISF